MTLGLQVNILHIKSNFFSIFALLGPNQISVEYFLETYSLLYVLHFQIFICATPCNTEIIASKLEIHKMLLLKLTFHYSSLYHAHKNRSDSHVLCACQQYFWFTCLTQLDQIQKNIKLSWKRKN